MARKDPLGRTRPRLAALFLTGAIVVVACGGDESAADREATEAAPPTAAEAAEVNAFEEEMVRDVELIDLVTKREIARLQAQLSTGAKLVAAIDTITGVHELVNRATEHARRGSTTKAIVYGLLRTGRTVEWDEGDPNVRYDGIRLGIHGDPDPENEGRDGAAWRCYAWPEDGRRPGLCFVAAKDGVVYGTRDASYLGADGPARGAANGEDGLLAPAKNAPWTGADGLTWRPAGEIIDTLQARLRRVREKGLDEDEVRVLLREALEATPAATAPEEAAPEGD
jgi:hypothetical protein